MTHRYLLRSKQHLCQYVACNLLPKGYLFYAISILPEDKDPLLVDAKLILRYSTHFAKSKVYRRRKTGFASVKYLRVGRMCLLIATTGTSTFFENEAWKDCREAPICFGGYSISVRNDVVSVRLHREAQNRLKRFILEWACRRDREWWEEWVRTFRFLPFAGVRDNLFALIRHLNVCRKHFRQPPIDWRECVRKRFTPEEVFLESPPEILELLQWEARKK